MRAICQSRTPWWRFDGTHAESTVTVGGQARTLVKITASGKLTIVGDVYADVWMCGCGAPGGDAQVGVKGGDGGGGAYAAEQSNLDRKSVV